MKSLSDGRNLYGWSVVVVIQLEIASGKRSSELGCIIQIYWCIPLATSSSLLFDQRSH